MAIFTVDRVGRKPLLIVGSAGMMIGMAAGAFVHRSIGIAALVFIIIYTASFMMSWGPICWVLISEIFPTQSASQAVAVPWQRSGSRISSSRRPSSLSAEPSAAPTASCPDVARLGSLRLEMGARNQGQNSRRDVETLAENGD